MVGGGYGLALQSVTKGWVGVKFIVKKRYVTLEWPLRRHFPRRSSKNCDLEFANTDRFKENYSIDGGNAFISLFHPDKY